jgi:leucyl/phenylalanyl-tRNA--protein transferase
MPVFKLRNNDLSFPNPAFAEGNGLLAIGGDLSVERLVVAYQNGIFPWFEEDGFFYWYAPDPRCVVFPSELKVHKSMRSIFNQNKFDYTLDVAFKEVMLHCGSIPRYGENGSWITDHFLEAYLRLHHIGIAHSVEVWKDGQLVGGLYGVSIGKMFFGESMFSLIPNASKAGFITLTRALERSGFVLVDCQLETEHLISLGARNIPRTAFMDALERNTFERTLIGQWQFGKDGTIEVAAD